MKTVEIRELNKDFPEARELVEGTLQKEHVSDVVVSETMLIFEALCHNIFEQRERKNAAVTVTGRRRFGSVAIMINFEGGMYRAESEDDIPTPEDMILNAYRDRIDYIYRSRFNSIRIQARRSYVETALSHLIAILLALAVFTVMHFAADDTAALSLLSNVIYPLEKLFTNAMLMIGAPVTFLSLLKNLTGIYILSERSSGVRQIAKQTLSSSVFSALLAVAVCLVIQHLIPVEALNLGGYGTLSVNITLSEFISELVPSDIFTPFQTISPFPLILLAGIITYAFCSVGKYFDRLMNAIDVCYALFSRLLSIVMYVLPFFTFCAAMHLLLTNGFGILLDFVKLIILVAVSIIIPAAYYYLKLSVNKVPVKELARGYTPFVAENYRIASAIDAVPFNVRYCIKTYGYDRRRLESSLPVLAQVNLDGNCYLITLICLIFVIFTGTGAQIGNMLLIAMLVFFLSLGAPNQPGSCIIGTLIILHYVGAVTFMPFAIFAEVLFGGLLNIMNVTGDLITVSINEYKAKRSA